MLRGLRAVRIRRRSQRRGYLVVFAGRVRGDRAPRLVARRDRVPHRGRPAPALEVRCLRRHPQGPQGGVPHGAPEGVHHGGDRFPGQAGQAVGARDDHGFARSRPGQLSRRRRGNFRREGARTDRLEKDEFGPLARSGGHGSRARIEIELHHAVRAHRGAAALGRSPDPPARTTGHHRRLPVLHPPGLPSGKHQVRPPSRPGSGGQAEGDRPVAPDAGQHPAHQGLLGDAGPGNRAARAAVRGQRSGRHRDRRARDLRRRRRRGQGHDRRGHPRFHSRRGPAAGAQGYRLQ